MMIKVGGDEEDGDQNDNGDDEIDKKALIMDYSNAPVNPTWQMVTRLKTSFTANFCYNSTSWKELYSMEIITLNKLKTLYLFAGRRISGFKGNYFWVPFFLFMETHQ